MHGAVTLQHEAYAAAPWHLLYFLPLPQGHVWLRPTFWLPPVATSRFRFPTILVITLSPAGEAPFTGARALPLVLSASATWKIVWLTSCRMRAWSSVNLSWPSFLYITRGSRCPAACRPGRDPALRARLGRVARRRGVGTLHRLLERHDTDSARRIQPRDEKRLIRALEVYLLTGRSLTDHFASTRSPIADYAVVTVGLQLPGEVLEPRIARRVDQQFAGGLLDEIRGLLAAGVPLDANPFGGLVYRQALEHLRGVRDEAATRALIVQENRRYARRQLIWFRKEPNLRWLCAPGECRETGAAVSRMLETARHA